MTAKVNWTLVDNKEKLAAAVAAIKSGKGPLGVDVERASGYRYFQKAYLLQIYRRESGAFIFDPEALETLAPLAQAIAGEEWVLHAANADLESLAGLGLMPRQLYDTELASRLLGFERVGLGSITEKLLSQNLEKAFSRADWSVRPLPDPWLEYAALDVVFLPDLRDATKNLLEESAKYGFAAEEFQALLNKPITKPATEPWRKLPGYGKLRSPKLQAIAQNLWEARDKFAREQDLAPGRVLPNASIMAATLMDPRSAKELARNKDFRGKHSRTELDLWWRAIRKAKISDPKELPTVQYSLPANNVKSWEKKNPKALERLTAARLLLKNEADRLNIPQENILSPAVVKAISWDPPQEISTDSIAEALQRSGARNWQSNLTAQLIAESFVDLL